jgi:hypothetical protein
MEDPPSTYQENPSTEIKTPMIWKALGQSVGFEPGELREEGASGRRI